MSYFQTQNVGKWAARPVVSLIWPFRGSLGLRSGWRLRGSDTHQGKNVRKMQRLHTYILKTLSYNLFKEVIIYNILYLYLFQVLGQYYSVKRNYNN